MENKKEKKVVYKTNKKLLKRLIIGIVIIFLILVFAAPIQKGIQWLYLNSWTWHDIENYGFSLKLPRAYKDIEFEENDEFSIDSSVFNTETSVEVNEEYISKKPEVVYNGGNILNGVGLTIQCLETERTTKTLEEIAESHHILVSIKYDDQYEIGTLEKEYVEILGSEAVKTSIDMSNDEESRTLVAYLLPLEDKEITIMFFGDKENISNSMEEIEKIVSKIK